MSSTLALPPAANGQPTFSLALPPNIARKSSVAVAAAGTPGSSTQAQSSSSAGPSAASAAPPAANAQAGLSNTNGRSVATQQRAASQSPAPDDDEDVTDADDDFEGGGGAAGGAASKKKSAGKKGKKAGDGAAGGAAQAKEYKYASEISQMMFVFGEVQDPLPETVRLVEDIVRGQIIEIVTRARLLTHMRNSRFLSAEDLIFLIRDDRSKVNRLRMYLSWKEVRKRAKEDESAEGPGAGGAGGSGGPGGPGGGGGGGGAGGDDDPTADGVGADMDKAALKGRKAMVKLPWEVLTPFHDFLRSVAKKDGRDDDEDEDEDEMQAYQDSMQRLRDADEITKKMTKDEYVHYSDCRQASFTYRKARRFRNFVNFSAYLEVRPNDDIIDILGFLSFEMVRSLCVTALEVRDRLEKSAPGHAVLAAAAAAPSQQPILEKRKSIAGPSATQSAGPSPSKRARVDSPDGSSSADGGGGGGEAAKPALGAARVHPLQPRRTTPYPVSLFAAPPAARRPLLPAHVLEAFAQIQRNQAAGRGGGVRNFRPGIARPRIALV